MEEVTALLLICETKLKSIAVQEIPYHSEGKEKASFSDIGIILLQMVEQRLQEVNPIP